MDLLTILWGASVLGAGSFFACGVATHATLTRRRGRDGELEGDVTEVRAPVQSQQIAALEASLARAALDARAHGERANTLEASLARVTQDSRAYGERASALEVSLARMSGETQGHAQRASTLESSLTKAQQELENQRAHASTQGAALARANAELATQRQRAAGHEHAQTQQVTALKSDGERTRKLEDELRRTLQTAQRVELELGEVRRSLAAAEQRAEESTTRAGSLAQELELALGQRTRARNTAPHPVLPPRIASADTVEANLAASLGTLADECGYDVVVLSDAQGLLLAGVGDEQAQGTVAALSSVARELTTRAAEFVELHPSLLEVSDDAGRTLRIRLFQWEQESIALASFGAGRTEPTRQEETVITVFPTLMAAS